MPSMKDLLIFVVFVESLSFELIFLPLIVQNMNLSCLMNAIQENLNGYAKPVTNT